MNESRTWCEQPVPYPTLYVFVFFNQLEGDEELFFVELHQILKHRTLMAEFQHADENMQRLRYSIKSPDLIAILLQY